MKLFMSIVVICVLILLHWQFDGHSSRVIEPQIHSRLSSDVCSVSASICRWVKIPYTNEMLRCIGGKSNFNLELEKSEHGIICPFGPVSRGLKRDLPRYSARVTVPIARGRRQVLYESPINGVVKICYDSQETNTVAVLLTVNNIMTRKESLAVVELKRTEELENLVRPLEEWESVVVFSDTFVAVRNKGESLFRGYIIEDSQDWACRGEGVDERRVPSCESHCLQ